MNNNPNSVKGIEHVKRTIRAEEVKAVVTKMTEDQLWDSVQARDVDPLIIEYVSEQVLAGKLPGEIARDLGLRGGKNSKEFKKILAYFRQGTRADADTYLYRQTHKYYKTIDDLRDKVEDAMENGIPHLVEIKGVGGFTERHEVIRIKGATPELAQLLKAYGDAISLPVKLWKDFGAIGEKKDIGPGGVTIVVQNKIPFPTESEIRAHQEEMKAKAKTIEVKGVDVTKPKT